MESIALSIGVHKSTISCELKRNSTVNGKYVWSKAQEMASTRNERSLGNRRLDDALKWRITELIKTEQWSPRQIAGRLKKEGIKVSHESIYARIRADDSGELSSHCRHKMKYKRKNVKKRETKATNIRNRASIHERPKEADGTRFGDWKMDLIVDKEGNAILTLLERSTNFMLMEKLKHGKKVKPWLKQSGNCCCHIKAMHSKQSQLITEASLQNTNGLQRSWRLLYILQIRTAHGRREQWKMGTSS